MKKLLLASFIAVTFSLSVRADTTTPRLGLILPTIGSPTWGQKMNYNMMVIDSTAPVGGGGGTVILSTMTPGATNFVFNQRILQRGATAYPDFLKVGSSATFENAIVLLQKNNTPGFAQIVVTSSFTPNAAFVGQSLYSVRAKVPATSVKSGFRISAGTSSIPGDGGEAVILLQGNNNSSPSFVTFTVDSVQAYTAQPDGATIGTPLTISTISPAGLGIAVYGDMAVRLYDSDSSHFTGLKSSGTVGGGQATNYDIVLPSTWSATSNVLTISRIDLTTTPPSIYTQWQPGSGGGTPGGSNTQMQLNDGGAFGGATTVTYSTTTATLTISSAATFTNVAQFNLTGVSVATFTDIAVVLAGTSTFSVAAGLPFNLLYKAAVCQGPNSSLGFSGFAASTPTAACVNTSSSSFGVAQFTDNGSTQAVQDHFTLPSDWTGSVDANIVWRSTATSGNVVWKLKTSCVADGEVANTSWNPQSTVTDAAKGTTLQFNTASITGVSTSNCAAGEEMFFQFDRDPGHASDTLASAGELITLGLKIRRTFQ